MTETLPPTDTRTFFRPVVIELVDLLREIPAQAWDAPTVARAWRVRDVVSHLLDTTLRRLSFHRDHHQPPPPSHPFSSDDDFVAFINRLNADWVMATRRISPALLTRLYQVAGLELAEFMEGLALGDPPLFPVSWAGDDGDAGWLDIGREFTEQWHHQMQVRDAAGAPPLGDPGWLHAVLLVAIRGLPHAYRAAASPPGTSVVIEITGNAGGTFTLRRDTDRWQILRGRDQRADARAVLSDDTAWRLLFNALPPEYVDVSVQRHGDTALLEPLIQARSVVV
jgi:Mycothiol maleylpyruvate isomerase N-terminal domain